MKNSDLMLSANSRICAQHEITVLMILKDLWWARDGLRWSEKFVT